MKQRPQVPISTAIWGLFWALAVSICAQPVKVAIITTDGIEGPAADLLTAQMSSKPGIQLLERNEIDKVNREQGLTAGNKDYLKLGQVLGADGLLLLSSLTDGTNHFLQTRLVAVRPGVIVSSVRSPWPIADQVRWASWISRHFEPLMPKLTVLAKDAIPVSIVNLRSAVRSAEGEQTERQLTLLAVDRLSRERELFVLERQRMELLGAEKELRGISESAFWNGSHLLEGVLDRDGYSKATLTLNARLLPPKGGAPVLIEVSGSRTNFSEVLNRLAGKVREGLQLRSQSVPWEAAEEAAQYLEEAQWAYKWGMLSEAQAACESSWALGRTTKEVAELRIRIYGRQGDPDVGDWLTASPSSPAYAPNAARLEPAIRALELYQQGFHSFLENQPKPDTNWYRLGLSLLGSELLRQFNYSPEACRGREEQLATLRRSCRSTADMLQTHKGYTNLSPPLPVARLGVSSLSHRPMKDLPGPFDIPLVRYGGAYWHETPEEGLKMYRVLADSAYLHTHRQQFAYHTIVGWNPADKQRAPALWRAFVSELCGSTNMLKRVEGYFLSFADASPQQQQERARAFFKVAIETAGPIESAGLAEGLVKDIGDLISDPPQGFPGNAINWSIAQSFSAFRDDLAAACEVAVRTRRLEAMKRFLASQISTNQWTKVGEFDQLFNFNRDYFIRGPQYNKSEAAALIPPLRELKRLLEERAHELASRKGAGTSDRINVGNTLHKVDELLAKLEPMVSPPRTSPSPTNLPAPARLAEPQRAKPTITRQAATRIPALLPFSTNTLKITRFWQWPSDLVTDVDMVPTAGNACFRNRQVWVQVYYKSQDVYLRKAFVFGVDPGTLSAEIIELPVITNTLVYSSTASQDCLETGNFFEVLGDHLFFSLRDKIKRYSFRSRAWEDLAVPTAGRLTVLDGRLFATTDDSIVEVAPDGNTQTIWASARRRPPITILDSLENYRQPSIFHGPKGSIATWINGRLYALDEKSKSWAEITSLEEQPASVPTQPSEQKALFYALATSGTNLVFIPNDQSSIAISEPQPPSLCHSNYSLRQCKSENPLWPGLDERGRLDTRLYLPKRGAWAYFSEHSVATTRGGPAILSGWRNWSIRGGPPLVSILWKDLGPPLRVPLGVDLSNAVISADLARHLAYGDSGSGRLAVQTIPTPGGIVLINAQIGLWVVPWKDLEFTLEAAKEERASQQAAQRSATDAMWEALFAKYHLDQKENFSPEQREAMIDDPVFLELSLDRIDRNGNGMLDAEELDFFDANRNGILEPQEQAGLETVLSLMTQRLFSEYDLDRDGQLDRTEFQDLVDDTRDRKARARSPINLEQFDLNRDGALSPVELQVFLKRELFRVASPGFAVGPNTPGPVLKMAVENYWARGQGRMAAPRFSRGERRSPPAAQPMSPPSKTPDEALVEAVDAGNLADARAALERGAKLDVRDDRGWTPLIIAAQAGRLDMVKLLLEKGADAKAQSTSKTGSTVLCFATESDNPELLALLVSHGADVNGQSRNLVAPLYTAATHEKRAAVSYLITHGARLEERGFLNEVGQRYTPLMAAAINGDRETMKILLDHGANHEATNSVGDTLVMILARMPQPEMLKLLIDRGANVNARRPTGHTALIYAAYNGRIDNVKLLLAAGADPSATASESASVGSPRYDAVLLAEEQNHPEVAALVKDAQAKKAHTQRNP